VVGLGEKQRPTALVSKPVSITIRYFDYKTVQESGPQGTWYFAVSPLRANGHDKVALSTVVK